MDPLTPKSNETPASPKKSIPSKTPETRPKRPLPKGTGLINGIPQAGKPPLTTADPTFTKKAMEATDSNKTSPFNNTNPFRSASTVSSNLPQTNSSSSRREKIDLRERSFTIPPSYYQRIRRKFQKRFAFHCTVLASFIFFLGLAFLLSGYNRLERSIIVEKVTQALSDLEADRVEEAQIQLEQSLQLFTEHQPKPSVQQWSRNIQLYNYMLRAGMAFRSLGDYRKALDTYQQIAFRNVKGLDTPLGSELTDHVKQLVNHERWSLEEIKNVHNYLCDMSPESWSPCDTLLIVATEIAGLKIVPMGERYHHADIVVYGKPAPMQTLEDERFRIDGLQYYRVDRLASPIEMEIPIQLTKKDRLRLQWYSECGRECLVFGKNTQRGGVQLIGLEGVLLSDTHTVELFNPLVERDSS